MKIEKITAKIKAGIVNDFFKNASKPNSKLNKILIPIFILKLSF